MIMKTETINKITEIPNEKYEGYIWLSDQTSPIVLDNASYDFSQIGENPFIIEALLFCKEKDFSIMVKHTGSYVIRKYDLKAWEAEAEATETKENLSHRIKGVKALKFIQFWKAEEDALCEGMPVLKLKATIFTGFKK